MSSESFRVTESHANSKGAADGVAAKSPLEPCGSTCVSLPGDAKPALSISSSLHADDSKQERRSVEVMSSERTDVLGGPLTNCWVGAPKPANEAERVKRIHEMAVKSDVPEERFDRITRIVSSTFNVPTAVITCIDEETVYMKSRVNYDEAYRARCQAICPWTIAQPKPDVLVVEDMHKDPQFRHFPLAVDGPLRFYAGAPIVTTDGLNLGTLCIVDTQPRTFTREDCRLLANFTEIVRAEMERDRICALAVESERARQAESFTSRLCRALDALSEAMLLVDTSRPGWPVLYSNTECADLFHTVPAEGSPLVESLRLTNPDGSQRSLEFFQEAVRNGAVFASPGTVCGTSGAEERVACRFKPAEETLNVNAAVNAPPVKAVPRQGSVDGSFTTTSRTSSVVACPRNTHLFFVTVRREQGRERGGSMERGRSVPESSTPGLDLQGRQSEGAEGSAFVDVRVGKLIGEGAYGKVYRGLWDGAPVAVKVMRHPGDTGSTFGCGTDARFEALLSVNMSHPNLVQTFKYSTRRVPAAEGEPAHMCETIMVQEYCDQGTLQAAVDKGRFRAKDSADAPDMALVVATAREIAGALKHLHSRNITHGDLSANNVLLLSRDRCRKGFAAKVGDFGLSRVVGSGESIKTTVFGTATHMPPELLRDGTLTPGTDVYSLGVIIWQMITGRRPFQGLSMVQVAHGVGQGRLRLEVQADASVPEDMRELVVACFRPLDARPTIGDVLETLMRLDMRGRRASKEAARIKVEMEAFLEGR